MFRKLGKNIETHVQVDLSTCSRRSPSSGRCVWLEKQQPDSLPKVPSVLGCCMVGTWLADNFAIGLESAQLSAPLVLKTLAQVLQLEFSPGRFFLGATG